METHLPQSDAAGVSSSASARSRPHPLVIAATLAIIVFSGAGIAAFLYERTSATPASPSPATISAPSLAQAPVAAPLSTPSTSAANGGSTTPSNTQAAADASAAPQGTLLSDGSILAPIEDSEPTATTPPPPPSAMAVPPCPQCATVVALHEVKVEGEGTGLGAVGGGVAGGVVGNALGSGRGRDVMTVLGAIGGAFAGNAIEKNARSKIDYEIVVRFENGHTRRFKRPQPWPYSVGEPVRVVKGELLPVHG